MTDEHAGSCDQLPRTSQYGSHLGYVVGTGLLFQASMLFVGLIGFLLLQPVLTDAPFALFDTMVILAMGLICFVPLGLFLRGVLRRA